MDSVTRLVLVDDDPLVRSGLSLILGGAPDLEVVAQAENGRLGVAAVRDRPGGVDVVLMDIRMPVLDGIDATRQIVAMPQAPYVIVLTTFGIDDHVREALAAGASGFLLKDTAPDAIVDAVRRVAAGEPIVSPEVLRTLISQVNARPRSASQAAILMARLTDREREVAEAVGRGLSNADIARELFLSVPTVKAHIGRLLDKLEVDNRVQAALVVKDSQTS